MGHVHYRAVHTRAPWRKVGNHTSLAKAKDGPNGAKVLVAGGLPKRLRDYGPVSCVVLWEQGASHGWIVRQSVSTGFAEECQVPIHLVSRFERNSGISSEEISNCFNLISGERDRVAASQTRALSDDLAMSSDVIDKRSSKKRGSSSSERFAGPAMKSRAKPTTVLEELGRTRLSKSFFLRDFLHSEISQIYQVPNIPDDSVLAIEAGMRLCQELLEPIQGAFGRLAIRSAYRSCEVNQLGNRNGHNCASNERNYAAHIWDRRDGEGRMGATACIVVPALVDYITQEAGSWTAMAWWVHDHLPYSRLQFFPRLSAFNIQWREQPERVIGSYAPPKGTMTKPGAANHLGDHSGSYAGLVAFAGRYV